MKRISKKVIGLIEWESPILDMSFMDDYDKEVDALLQAQLESCEKDHEAEIREIWKELEDKMRMETVGSSRYQDFMLAISTEELQAIKSKHIKEA